MVKQGSKDGVAVCGAASRSRASVAEASGSDLIGRAPITAAGPKAAMRKRSSDWPAQPPIKPTGLDILTRSLHTVGGCEAGDGLEPAATFELAALHCGIDHDACTLINGVRQPRLKGYSSRTCWQMIHLASRNTYGCRRQCDDGDRKAGRWRTSGSQHDHRNCRAIP